MEPVHGGLPASLGFKGLYSKGSRTYSGLLSRCVRRVALRPVGWSVWLRKCVRGGIRRPAGGTEGGQRDGGQKYILARYHKYAGRSNTPCITRILSALLLQTRCFVDPKVLAQGFVCHVSSHKSVGLWSAIYGH